MNRPGVKWRRWGALSKVEGAKLTSRYGTRRSRPRLYVEPAQRQQIKRRVPAPTVDEKLQVYEERGSQGRAARLSPAPAVSFRRSGNADRSEAS